MKMINFLLGLSLFLGMINFSWADVDENFTEREVTFGEAESKITKVIAVLEEMAQGGDKVIPTALWRQAEAIVVIPDLIEAGIAIAVKAGRGVAAVRNENGEWSNPVFISSAGASIGIQAGAQSSDIILVMTNKNGIEKMVNGKFTVGVDAAVAAGPIGRTAEAGVNVDFSSPVYSYSRSAGVFAGVSVEGTALEVDKAANKGFYGQDVLAAEIFSGKAWVASEKADALKTALKKYAE